MMMPTTTTEVSKHLLFKRKTMSYTTAPADLRGGCKTDMMMGKTVLWFLLLAAFLVVSPVLAMPKVFAQQQEQEQVQIYTRPHSELVEIPEDSSFWTFLHTAYENVRLVGLKEITGWSGYEALGPSN
jgi:hypothetical protein